MDVYLYGRHSTGKQSATEDVQRAACEGFFKNTLKPKGGKLVGWFYDPAVSGGKGFADRPAGVQVWVSAAKGDYVVVSHLDRAFRSLIDGANCVEAMKQRGVHFVALDLGLDTSTPMGEFALHIFLAAAQMQRRYIAERTREVIQHKLAMGKPHAAQRTGSPIGWRQSGLGWIEAPDEREQVEKLCAMRDSGMSVPRIEQAISKPELRGQFVRRYAGSKRWTPRYIRLAFKAKALGYPKCFLNSRQRRQPADQTPASA
jgi:DNA invertase Pin-like site-specific DNA recombinase